MSAKLVLFVYFWVVISAVGICAVEQSIYWHTKYMRAAILIRHYDARVRSLEDRENEFVENLAKIEARQREIKAWRISVTLASRISWPAASRYIREYPLEDVLEEAKGF